MKNVLLGVAIAIASLSASATETINNRAGAVAGALASNQIGIVNTTQLGIGVAVRTGDSMAFGGASSVGNVGASVGEGAGAASIDYKAAASSAYAPNGQAPRTSCRLFIGLGGSERGGSLSGGIPIGNDQTCNSGSKMEFMDKVNSVKRGTFGVDDYMEAACEVEGMAKTQGCKDYAKRKPQEVAPALPPGPQYTN